MKLVHMKLLQEILLVQRSNRCIKKAPFKGLFLQVSINSHTIKKPPKINFGGF